MRRIGLSRRGLLAAALAAAAASTTSAETTAEVRIGYQKYGALTIAKAQGGIDARLAEKGRTVRWIEFPAGPQLLEALNVGSIDFGTTGEAPPIFAQAAGAPLVYVGHHPGAPEGEAIIVPSGSPLRSVADLKGRKVALNKGSNVHYLLVRTLEAHGLAYRDVQPIFLPPADARAAFEQGAVDAWAIWDPFLAAAQAATGARVLADGTGLVANHQFYLASRAFLDAHPDLVSLILDELRRSGRWVLADPARADRLLSPQVGIPAEVLEIAVRRQRYGIEHLGEAAIAEQQRIADTFHALGLIPKPIRVREAVWTPDS